MVQGIFTIWLYTSYQCPLTILLRNNLLGAEMLKSARNRREFLALGFAQLSTLAIAQVGGSTKSEMKTVSTFDLPHIDLNGWQARILELSFPAGLLSPKHTHPGFVLGYVLEGEFRFHIEGQPERILSAGETFYEPPGAVHLPSGSASTKTAARVLVWVFAEKGKDLTTLL
jgi:quercetin dioxygenase-like cupin family protein